VLFRSIAGRAEITAHLETTIRIRKIRQPEKAEIAEFSALIFFTFWKSDCR